MDLLPSPAAPAQVCPQMQTAPGPGLAPHTQGSAEGVLLPTPHSSLRPRDPHPLLAQSSGHLCGCLAQPWSPGHSAPRSFPGPEPEHPEGQVGLVPPPPPTLPALITPQDGHPGPPVCPHTGHCCHLQPCAPTSSVCFLYSPSSSLSPFLRGSVPGISGLVRQTSSSHPDPSPQRPPLTT